MSATVFDKFPMPPCAKLLGWTLLDSNPEEGWAQLCFEAKPEFLNPAGFVQGGILSAMLDDAMGPAVLIASHGTFFTATIDMHVSFLAPARPGKIYAKGHIVQMGKTIAFLEAELRDGKNTVIARAVSTARLVPTERLQ